MRKQANEQEFREQVCGKEELHLVWQFILTSHKFLLQEDLLVNMMQQNIVSVLLLNKIFGNVYLNFEKLNFQWASASLTMARHYIVLVACRSLEIINIFLLIQLNAYQKVRINGKFYHLSYHLINLISDVFKLIIPKFYYLVVLMMDHLIQLLHINVQIQKLKVIFCPKEMLLMELDLDQHHRNLN